MKINTINGIQKSVLESSDKGYGCATCGLISLHYRKRYHELIKFYYTGYKMFWAYETLSYLYFDRYFGGLNQEEKDQITYYRLFMLEIFKDVVRNEKI